MGTVQCAVDETTGRRVALKWMPRGNPSQELRFRREFHTLASLEHPRIVKVFDYGVEPEGLYYTMELLDGQDLRKLHHHHQGPLFAPQTIAYVLRDVASALALLHSRRLVHRDVSPRNVRLTSTGQAKLFDFGVLANVGVAGDIAGTPPFVAPESLRGLPIDTRTDLYALGALAYWLATGRHAFAARSLDELPDVWRQRPAVPSTINPDVSSAFDELVMALLSHDPMARPAHAGEVIDRLTALGSLPAAPEVETARGYLASAPLVGRHDELERLRKMIRRAVDGEFQGVVIAAASGQGKSRLLREVGLQAQLAGAKTVHCNAGSTGGPYQLMRTIARGLKDSCPEAAIRAARPIADVVAHVVPEIAEGVDLSHRARLSGDPGEDRARIQDALQRWLLEVAEKRPLVLSIDDLQRADEASSAVLAAIAQLRGDAHLMLAFGLRTDEAARAPTPVETIRGASPQIPLRGLSREETTWLVTAVLGELPQADRLGQWLHRVGGGSPLHCTELLHHAVDRGIIRYQDGIWTVPEHFELDELPRGLSEAMDLRVGKLGTSAKQLGQQLSLVRGEASLPLCLRLMPDDDESTVFAALDELGQQGVVVQVGQTVRFAHDGLREALKRTVRDEPASHRRVARALAPEGIVPQEREAEVGWHLLAAGDALAGAKHLESAGRRLHAAQSLADAVEPLSAALQIYEDQDVSPRLCFELRRILVMGGVLGHVETLRRYGGETLAAAWSYAGLDVAERWGPRMGRPLALALGLGAAGIRYACTPRHRKGPTPVDALGTVLVFCSAMSTYFTATLESPPRHRALLGKMRVFDAFKRQILHGTYLACLNNGDVENGLFARALGRCGGCLELVHNDTRTPITPEERTAMLAMVHGQDAFVRILVHDPECESALQRLHDLGLLSVEFGADMYRALFHRMRGEEEEATRLFRQADAERLRAGDGWIWNSQATWVSALAYAGTRDVLGLRRTLERLEQYLEHGYGFEAVRTLTLGEYRRCRGELEGAREALESLIQDEQAPGFVRPHALAALAETYMVLRMGEAATYAAVQGSALASAPERGDLPARVRCQIVLGLMEQESGNGAGASARLDGIVEEAERQQSPALAAAAHEARARLAYAMEDPDRLSRHADAMGRWVRPTRNPALLQRLEQTLLLLGETAGEDALDEGGTVTAVGPASMDQSQVSASLRAARNGRERAEIALQVILQHTSASHGFLFKRHSNGLQLLAPEHGEEPPTELRETLAAMVQQDDERIAGNRPSGPVEVGGLHSIVLRHPDDGRCVAAAVVAPPPAGLKSSPPAEVLQELARGLLELGDPREPVFRSSVPPPP